ncbi:MAG: N-acetyltransferase [Clostridiales bacterium]|nr:N-acetyltransferase [Clostridiales bacterium]
MIRPAQKCDLPAIEAVYAVARGYMARTGNPSQWGNIYPKHDLLVSDIEKGELFVCEEEGVIRGVFAFIVGDDPTYAYIEDGKWPHDKPYGTIHRIASDGQTKGIFTKCFAYALSQMDEIRIDTHHDNKTMQHVVEKHGFKRCGIIYVQDGSPRIAYQYSKENP